MPVPGPASGSCSGAESVAPLTVSGYPAASLSFARTPGDLMLNDVAVVAV